ncbi:adenosylcobinamide-phosphate synthase CbiB [Alloalcanivorax sp. C16-1]|uniref:adenosylcobinamide-phosphate synthase CbiB n=1 Tax=Alloalcanivorax sp. C16-1 TaxID=3390051 RepID=UPI003970B6F2
MWSLTLAALAAVALDRVLGEPGRGHPLVALGRAADRLERRLNRQTDGDLGRGALAVAVLALPPVLAALALTLWLPIWLLWPLQVLGLWLALGARSLAEHGRAVAAPLATGDLPEARRQVARIVSRDTDALDPPGVARAATESMLENGADAVFASLFWFLVAGLPGVLLHRIVNTLDALWGYRTPRYERFGKAAARLDDALNWVPARLTALSYGLCGHLGPALRCWREQARHWDSPNAGPVMAAGAGALSVTLGGPAPYHGALKQRPPLGLGPAPDAATIDAALALIRRALVLWLALAVLIALIIGAAP